MKLTCISTPEGTLGFRIGKEGSADMPCEVNLSNDAHQIVSVPFMRDQVRELCNMLQQALDETKAP